MDSEKQEELLDGELFEGEDEDQLLDISLDELHALLYEQQLDRKLEDKLDNELIGHELLKELLGLLSLLDMQL